MDRNFSRRIRSEAFLAQWLERVAVNHKVVGSIPTGGVVCCCILLLANRKFQSLLHVSTTRVAEDTVSEWLRRWTRNPLGSAREGSNPFGVGFFCVARFRRNAQMRCPGIEPGPSAWKADILTTRPTTPLAHSRTITSGSSVTKPNAYLHGEEKSGHPESNQGPSDTHRCFYSQTLYQLSYVRSRCNCVP